jgi:hypothetical protein
MPRLNSLTLILVSAFVKYGETDEPHLNELRNVVEEFRELIKETWRYFGRIGMHQPERACFKSVVILSRY